MAFFLILFIFQNMLKTYFLSNDGYIFVNIVDNVVFPLDLSYCFSPFIGLMYMYYKIIGY